VITVLLLVGIGLAIFFLYPRSPDVQVGDPTVKNFDWSITQGLTWDLDVNVNVHNPNYFSIQARIVKADIYYRDMKVMTTNQTEKVNFPARSTVNMTMRTRANNTLANLPDIINALDQDCGIPPKAGQSLTAHLDGYAEIDALLVVRGRKYDISRDLRVDCNSTLLDSLKSFWGQKAEIAAVVVPQMNAQQQEALPDWVQQMDNTSPSQTTNADQITSDSVPQAFRRFAFWHQNRISRP